MTIKWVISIYDGVQYLVTCTVCGSFGDVMWRFIGRQTAGPRFESVSPEHPDTDGPLVAVALKPPNR